MSDEQTIYDDPIWEYLVVTKLQPYLPAVRRWWSEYENMRITRTGIMPIEYKDMEVPPGLQMRMTNTPVRSPIKNVQAFPYVPTSYLEITGVKGGVNRMIERVCFGGFKLEEFTLIEKHNLPSTYNKGQFVAFIPTKVLEGAQELGKYVYLTVPELIGLAQGVVVRTVPGKCARYIDK